MLPNTTENKYKIQSLKLNKKKSQNQETWISSFRKVVLSKETRPQTVNRQNNFRYTLPSIWENFSNQKLNRFFSVKDFNAYWKIIQKLHEVKTSYKKSKVVNLVAKLFGASFDKRYH